VFFLTISGRLQGGEALTLSPKGGGPAGLADGAVSADSVGVMRTPRPREGVPAADYRW